MPPVSADETTTTTDEIESATIPSGNERMEGIVVAAAILDNNAENDREQEENATLNDDNADNGPEKKESVAKTEQKERETAAVVGANDDDVDGQEGKKQKEVQTESSSTQEIAMGVAEVAATMLRWENKEDDSAAQEDMMIDGVGRKNDVNNNNSGEIQISKEDEDEKNKEMAEVEEKVIVKKAVDLEDGKEEDKKEAQIEKDIKETDKNMLKEKSTEGEGDDKKLENEHAKQSSSSSEKQKNELSAATNNNNTAQAPFTAAQSPGTAAVTLKSPPVVEQPKPPLTAIVPPPIIPPAVAQQNQKLPPGVLLPPPQAAAAAAIPPPMGIMPVGALPPPMGIMPVGAVPPLMGTMPGAPPLMGTAPYSAFMFPPTPKSKPKPKKTKLKLQMPARQTLRHCILARISALITLARHGDFAFCAPNKCWWLIQDLSSIDIPKDFDKFASYPQSSIEEGEEEEKAKTLPPPAKKRGRPRKTAIVEDKKDKVETPSPIAKKRGRPRKKVEEEVQVETPIINEVKKRGRPRKTPDTATQEKVETPKRKRGRPKKNAAVAEEEDKVKVPTNVEVKKRGRGRPKKGTVVPKKKPATYLEPPPTPPTAQGRKKPYLRKKLQPIALWDQCGFTQEEFMVAFGPPQSSEKQQYIPNRRWAVNLFEIPLIYNGLRVCQYRNAMFVTVTEAPNMKNQRNRCKQDRKPRDHEILFWGWDKKLSEKLKFAISTMCSSIKGSILDPEEEKAKEAKLSIWEKRKKKKSVKPEDIETSFEIALKVKAWKILTKQEAEDTNGGTAKVGSKRKITPKEIQNMCPYCTGEEELPASKRQKKQDANNKTHHTSALLKEDIGAEDDIKDFPLLASLGIRLGFGFMDVQQRQNLLREMIAFDRKHEIPTKFRQLGGTGRDCHLVCFTKRDDQSGFFSRMQGPMGELLNAVSTTPDKSADFLCEYLAKKRPASFMKAYPFAKEVEEKKGPWLWHTHRPKDFKMHDESDESNEENVEWNIMYTHLLQYKKEYGHCNVPLPTGSFGEWVLRVRQAKKKNDPNLTPKRIELLEKIGFEWVVKKKFVGVPGDPRMNLSLVAKLSFPSLSYPEALLLGGYEREEAYKHPGGKRDTLCRRKRQFHLGVESKVRNQVKKLLFQLYEENGVEELFGKNRFYEKLILQKCQGKMKKVSGEELAVVKNGAGKDAVPDNGKKKGKTNLQQMNEQHTLPTAGFPGSYAHHVAAAAIDGMSFFHPTHVLGGTGGVSGGIGTPFVSTGTTAGGHVFQNASAVAPPLPAAGSDQFHLVGAGADSTAPYPTVPYPTAPYPTAPYPTAVSGMGNAAAPYLYTNALPAASPTIATHTSNGDSNLGAVPSQSTAAASSPAASSDPPNPKDTSNGDSNLGAVPSQSTAAASSPAASSDPPNSEDGYSL